MIESLSRVPVRTLEDLDGLDIGEVVDGYRDGRDGLPCGDNRSRAFWHGWRNGRADAGLEAIDADQRELARLVVERSRQRRAH